MSTIARFIYYNPDPFSNPLTIFERTADFLIPDFNYKRNLNEDATFEFSLPIASLKGRAIDFGSSINGSTTGDFLDFYVTIYEDGEELIQGPAESIEISFINETPHYKISCSGEFSDLSRKRAISTANYQNVSILDALVSLLLTSSSFSDSTWQIGDISTMIDPDIKTTIDLRGEKRLFSQIRRLVESVPNLFFRYGGILQSSNPNIRAFLIDLGTFNKQLKTKVPIRTIKQLSQSIRFSECLGSIESYGGEITVAGIPRKINLDDAATYKPTLVTGPLDETDPYTIYSFGSGKKAVQSNLNINRDKVEYYSEIVPITKTDPTADEIGQAGYALYLKTCAELSQVSIPLNEWQATLTELPEEFKLGSQIYLDASAQQLFYDRTTETEVAVEIGRVREWFRVNGYSVSIKDKKTSFNVDLGTNFRLKRVDPIVALYESIGTTPEDDSATPTAIIRIYETYAYSIPVGLIPNSMVGTGGDEYPAILIEIPVTPVLGATSISLFKYFSVDDDVSIIISTLPTLASPIVQLYVSRFNNWTVDDSATIKVVIQNSV